MPARAYFNAAFAFLLAGLPVAAADAPQEPDDRGAEFFVAEVLPILKAHCHSCHAAEAGGEVDGGFNMASRELFVRGGQRGNSVDEREWLEHTLLAAINFEDLQMPPRGKLPQSQIDTLTRWVKMGLPWSDTGAAGEAHGPPAVDDRAREFWSFQPIERPEVPDVGDSSFVTTPVDAFVLARLRDAGLAPPPPANKTAQLRRVYYSLTGLPPTPTEVAAFLADESSGAYERVVDRLLDSPQYGERWARHWLDLVRYAETDGYEFDRAKPEVWRFRDYVIDAFNSDKPYDVFVTEQLAGDELEQETAEGIIATGYYKLGARDSGAADRLQAEFDELDDVIATTGQVMLGLTMNCARCHDHKIDPIPTADYYRMLAFFRGIKRGRGESTRRIQITPDGGSQHAVEQWGAEYDAATRGLQRIEGRLRRHITAGEADDFEEESNRPAIVRANSPEHVSAAELAEYEELLATQRHLDSNRPDGLARALCVLERGPTPPPTHVLIRGSPYAEGEPVSPGFPSVITSTDPAIAPPDPLSSTSGRRRVLAEWITSRDNPLTARVMANRLWHYNFDRGIVRTTSDFGFAGAPPTHPALLDWIASELVDGGWRLKRLQKLMVMSSTFRASSVATDDAALRDPENDLFSRFNLRRLEAEEIRDSILAVSGNLNKKMYGPSTYPKIADEVLAGQSRPGQGWRLETPPEEQARRSVYIHIKRSLAVPLLAVFDAADTDTSCSARFATTQPTQALTMLNSEFLNEQAVLFATDVRSEAGAEPPEQVAEALRRVTQREPTEAEIHRGLEMMQDLARSHGVPAGQTFEKFCLLAMNLNEFMYLDQRYGSDAPPVLDGHSPRVTMTARPHEFCGRTRRELLWQAGAGFTGVALSGLLDSGFFGTRTASAAPNAKFDNPLAATAPMIGGKAKSVIFLFMYGGPSHIDTFDYKPAMVGMDNKTVNVKTAGRGGKKNQGRIVEPRWKFQQYGECGKWVSDLYPHLGKRVDDIAFIHSMTADSPQHGSAMLQMNSGKILSGAPCLGSWVNYGLGSVNENLPGFVVMLDPRGGPISGPKNWSSGYMPAHYQGTVFRSTGEPILDLRRPDGLSDGAQRSMLDTLRQYNDDHFELCGRNPALASRVASYELAYKMQSTAPDAIDLSDETEETKRLYGMDEPRSSDFGRQCLLARRMVERGVRFIQIYSGGNHNDTSWDAHGDLVVNHELHCGETDKPMAGLITDLKRRGLFEETLIVWGGEFGRQPTAEYAKGTGRDHNSYGFTMWMAGGGVKGGVSLGKTDELGSAAVEKPLHVKNLHATILHQLGIDPNRLTYFQGGLDQKLVGVEDVEPIWELV